MKLAGIVLIVLGALALAYQGIRYTTREKLIDIGPLKVTATEKKTIPLPPIVGGVAIVAGIALILVERRKT
jgi:UDP-N-acetylmuramyl pentapeptide phosphotransferase/UDP-N-acetylglucosamine-1-phosphate transferase